jgi:hypothetical protein
LLDKMKAQIVGVYCEATGMSADDMHKLMDAETWMSGDEAVQLGFADETSEPLQMAANLDLAKFSAKLDPRAAQLFADMTPKETSHECGTATAAPVAAENTLTPAGGSVGETFTAADVDRARADGLAEGLRQGRAEHDAELSANLTALASNLDAASLRCKELSIAKDKAEAATADLNRQLEAERAAHADTRKLLAADQARFANALVAFRLTPETTWADALKKCGNDYAKARKEYPAAYAAFMAAKTNHKGKQQ